MKKIVVIALIATMLIGMLVFSACKSKETQEQGIDTTTTAVPETTYHDTTATMNQQNVNQPNPGQ